MKDLVKLKSYFTILLSCILLFSGMFPGITTQFSRIPQLLEHYNEHQKVDKTDISFTEFLALHYFSEHGSKAEHADLPDFKISTSSSGFILPESTIITILLPEKNESQHLIVYLLNYFFESNNSLLEPPRFS